MKESWEEQMRRKLEGHKVAPPEGLWEDICKELDVRGHSTNRRWYYAVAAALLGIAGFFAVYQLNNNNETKELTVKSEMTAPEKQDAPASEEKVDDKLALATINHKVSKKGNLTKCQTPCEPEPCELEPSAPEPEPESDDDLNKDVLQESDSEEPVTEPQAKKPVDDPRTYQLPSSEPSPKRNETSDRWSLGLTASGGLLAANNSVNTNLLYYKNVNSIDYAFYGITSQFSNAQTEFVWKHRLPLRFGLSVHYQLNDRLSLLSGISYTYLYSECSIPLYNINYNQKLHYLGIPIGMVWQLWSSGHFRLYLSGSAMLEKCVHASFDYKSSDGVDIEKPWQWSLNAAAGAEYSFTPQLSVYLEPSLGYYFDDGSSLEHYYKEHPLAPSISFGLRFNLNPR
jgi:hypothetical protein